MREMKPPVSGPELAQHPLHPGTWMKPRSFTFVVLAGYWNTNHVDNVTLVDSCFVVDVVHCIRFLSSFTQSINQFDFLLFVVVLQFTTSSCFHISIISSIFQSNNTIIVFNLFEANFHNWNYTKEIHLMFKKASFSNCKKGSFCCAQNYLLEII